MTSLLRTIQRNSLFSLLSTVVRLFANAVLFILVAKYYGPVRFGQFTTAHTLAIIFTLLADFGFDLFLTTEISRNRHVSTYLAPRMFGVKLVLSLVAAFLMCAYAVVQSMSEGTRVMVLIFSLYLFFSALLNSMFALFKAHDELHHESRVTFIMNATLLVVLVILGALRVRLEYVAAAFVGSRVFGLGLALAKTPRFVPRLVPVLDFSWFRTVWKDVSVFGVFFVFGNLYFMLDTLLLSIWKGDHEVGIYQSVYRIIALTLVLPEITVNAILPSLSRLNGSDHARWVRLGSAASRVLFHCGLFVGFVLMIGARQIVAAVYGLESYGAAVPIMRIFGAIVIIRYAVEIPALMLTTSRRQHVRMVLVVAATAVNFALNVYAIPRFGVDGAAIVSLVTNVLVGLSYVVAVRRVYDDAWISRERIIPFVVIAVSVAVMMAFPGLPFWLGLIMTTLAYVPVAYAVGYTIEEKGLVIQTATAVLWR